MANPICIPAEFIDDIEKIIDENDTSLSRVSKLTEYFKGNAKSAQEANSLYEKKLLLNNQTEAINNFIDSVNGLDLQKKELLKEKVAARLVQRTETIQNDELLSIAKEIFDKKYDLDIKLEDVNVLNKLKREAYELEKTTGGTPSYSKERIAHAGKIIELSEYIDNLINPEQTLGFKATIKDVLKKAGQRFEGKTSIEKVLESGKLTTDVLTSAVYKSIQASIDASFALRQGFKILATNPKAWRDNLVKAFEPFKNITTPIEKYKVLHGFKVKLASNELYQQALDSKLAIGVVEEFFPTTLAEKIPGLGRLFKASNEAFTIFSQGSRMSLFEDMVKKATANGTKLTPEMSKELAMVANSITGRGNVGDFEKIPNILNKFFFSGRFIKSQLDTFYLPFKPGLSPVARKVAMQSSLRTLSMFAGIMATASLFTDVETDPRSSKFGKMKLPGSKDTWIDISGGLGSYITLASRIATKESKSSLNNRITKLNTGEFGSKTSFDVAIDFLTNKLAPMPSDVAQRLKGRTFNGEKPSLGGSLSNLATPISAGNAYEIFQNEDVGTALMATMFDMLGAGQTDYTQFRK